MLPCGTCQRSTDNIEVTFGEVGFVNKVEIGCRKNALELKHRFGSILGNLIGDSQHVSFSLGVG